MRGYGPRLEGRGMAERPRVGFDAHMVGKHETGNETYALGLLHGLDAIGFSVDAYSAGALPPSIHRRHTTRPSASSIRIPVVTPALAARDGLDIFHSTYVAPPFLPCKSVVTVHDITFDLHPEWFTARVRTMLGTLVPYSLRHAARIITISECTRRDLVERFGLSPERIAVTHLAPRPQYIQPRPRAEGSDPFFLFVGNIEPRKNLETVLYALRLLWDRGVQVPLVIAGKAGYSHERVLRLITRLRLYEAVRFTGYVPDNDLLQLYAQATALVHPALYEGFGLTVLEAMVQGVPVLASGASSIPEVAGDAALLLDPLDVEAWADAMERVAGDPYLRAHLSAAGQERSTHFSWESCARQTVAAYQHVLAG